MKSVCIMIVLLLTSCLWAESLPDAPNPQKQAAPPAAGGMLVRSTLNSEGGKPVADRTFWMANSAMYSIGIANVELAHQCVVSHSCTLSQLPSTSRAALYAMALPANFVATAVSYKLKKDGHRWWFVPTVLSAGAQMYSAGHMIHRMNQH